MKKDTILLITILFGLSINGFTQCVQCSGDDNPLGTNASTLGTLTYAAGHSAFASGYNSSASGAYSSAMGDHANASGTNSVAIGKDISVTANNSFVIGNGFSSSATLTNTVAKSIMFGVNSSTPSITIRQKSTQDVMAYVGIGTTNPMKEFHVNGNTMISGTDNALLFSTSQYSSYGHFGIKYSNNGLNFFLPNGGSTINNLLFIKSNGNIGIGTGNPSYKLDVSGTARATALQSTTLSVSESITIGNLAGNTTRVVTVGTGGVLSATDFSTMQDNLGNHTATQNLNMNGFKIINDETNGGLYVDTNNYIGLGTVNPKQMLHIVGGNILISRVANRNDKAPGSINGSILFGDVTSTQYPFGSWGIEYLNDNNNGHGLNFWKTHDANNNNHINYVLFLCEESNYLGNVGIGTSKPKHKLSVNGTIQAKELIVTTLAADWPDFVFDPDYKLTSLKELGKYVESERHLPGVPSANEISDEGIKVGEMNAILLQKVEELTLYVIELQKQIDELKGDN